MSNVSITEQSVPLKTRILEAAPLFLSAAFLITDIILCFQNSFITMRQKAVLSLTVEIFAIAICHFLYFSAWIDDRRSPFRKLFMELIFIEVLAFFLDSMYWFTAKKPSFNTFLIIDNALLYLSCGGIFVCFWGCEIEIMNLRGKLPKFILYGLRVMTIAYYVSVLLNMKFGFYYKITDGIFRSAKTAWIELLFPFIICEVLIFYALRVKTFIKIKLPFILMAVLPVCAMVIQHFFYLSWILYIAVLLATFVLFLNVQVDLGHKIEEFKNKVMISQIQPHFMYNTLTTIKALCRVDPDLAAKTITNFADYLRGNMDFASLQTTIPLERELKHTRIYTEIEALRFDNITFEFKIEDENFQIPALCIQPMVENAVRHGVRSKKDGHILIHTFEDEKFHNVVIKDNGKGFDNAQFNGSRTHIGLLNTRLRVERLVNGIFEVESIPDVGVTITMRIPKK